MAGKCRVCEHRERAAIDKALVTRSASLRTIADRYGLSKTALIRHRDNHIPKLVQAAESARAMQAASSGAALIDELDRLLERALLQPRTRARGSDRYNLILGHRRAPPAPDSPADSRPDQ